MPVFLDDQAVDWPARTLAEALDAASRHTGDSDRIVTDVYLDGQALMGSELDDNRDTDITEAQVRLYSADPAELAVTTLEQVRGRLDEARRLQSNAAELFQKDQPAEAIQCVADAAGAWQQVQ